MASTSHRSHHIITTPRLYVRSANLSDAEGIYRVLSNPLNFPHNPVDPDLTPEVFEKRIAKWKAAASKGESAFMIVVLRETNQVIGMGGFNVLRQWPALDGSGELELEGDTGLVLDHSLWRKGYAREAFCGTCEYGFDELHCGHMFVDTSLENEEWRSFMRHLGLGEGELEQLDGREGENYVYRFDKNTWLKVKENLIAKGKWPL